MESDWAHKFLELLLLRRNNFLQGLTKRLNERKPYEHVPGNGTTNNRINDTLVDANLLEEAEAEAPRRIALEEAARTNIRPKGCRVKRDNKECQ